MATSADIENVKEAIGLKGPRPELSRTKEIDTELEELLAKKSSCYQSCRYWWSW